jgi:hypothetical protein
MDPLYERATVLLKGLIDVPVSRFTLGELLFLTERFRYNPAVPQPCGVTNLNEEDV